MIHRSWGSTTRHLSALALVLSAACADVEQPTQSEESEAPDVQSTEQALGVGSSCGWGGLPTRYVQPGTALTNSGTAGNRGTFHGIVLGEGASATPLARCRDGSVAGVTFRKSPTNSRNLLFYFGGGGACFNDATCALTPSALDCGKAQIPDQGIFVNGDGNPADAWNGNQFANWNVVYVPYCTGDLALGNKKDVEIPNVSGKQYFYGRYNLDLILLSVKNTFGAGALDKVLIAGESAGGIGATGNALHIKNALGNSATTYDLVNDSGPFLSADATDKPPLSGRLPTCAQADWRDYWGLDKTVLRALPTECASCVQNGAVVANWAPKLGEYVGAMFTLAGRKPGLVVSYNDGILGVLFAQARNSRSCGSGAGYLGFDVGLGLAQLRKDTTNIWRTYYVNSSDHTYLNQSRFFSTNVGAGSAVNLSTWVHGSVLNQSAQAQVGP